MKKFILCLFFIGFAGNNAQEYAGSESCKTCHSTQHTNWKASGHPYKIQKLQGGNGPVYPVLTAQKTIGTVVNYTLKSGIPNAPAGLAWSDIGFVLGGYHSNARFLDKEGYLIYGANRQYNLSTNIWVAYTSGTLTKGTYSYSCYKCHTTGPSKTKTAEFQAYPGIEGSWSETGIGCEGCHGAAKGHVSNVGDPTKRPTTNIDCDKCHARDRNDADATYNWNKRVEWQAKTVGAISTGFIRHREQGDMMLASKHKTLSCATCHDAHKGVYFDQGGIKASAKCQNCHPNKEIAGHELTKTKAECTDCHMPKAARNGDNINAYISEQSTHFWKVNTNAITMFDNLETINNSATPPVGFKFIKQDAGGMSSLTLDYTCIQCHTTKDINWASLHAKSMHSKAVSVENTSDIPSAYTLAQNYPNPFNPSTSIRFALPKSSNVILKVYAITGEVVATLANGNMNEGWHEVKFNASNLASGVYVYRIEAGDFAFTRKMLLMK